MDNSKMSLSPLPPTPSFPSSTSSSPRKRSIHEVDDAALPSVGPKRALKTFTGENQENHDPVSVQVNKETTAEQGTQETDSASGNPTPQVVIPFKGSEPALAPTAAGSDATGNNAAGTPQGSPVKTDMAAAKKRKLSPNSKEAKQQEKELKERQRLEEKAKKEEEKRLKDEEKKKRDAEREEEKRVKEEERKKREAEREEKKKAKEEEKKAKEEERKAKEEEKAAKEAAAKEAKLKKERAQPKLNSFFAKPQLPVSPAKKVPLSPSKSASNSDIHSTASQKPQSDYAKVFPEFFLQSHTVVAPPHRFERDADALTHVRHTIDASLNSHDNTSEPLPFRASEIFHMIPYRRRRGRNVGSVKDILLRMQTLSDAANLPGGQVGSEAVKGPLEQLRRIRMKSLKFGEDVRPAYQGTFTRTIPEDAAKKVCRNPYHRGLPETNYDYDSEAEWEEPEEGEDLDSEEEEEGSDEGEDDMEGFLDDEDDALAGGKRRLIVGDLEPVCSGIHWAGDGDDGEFKTYQIETISDAVQFPIDPFSTAYWQKPRAADQTLQKARATQKPGNSLDAFRVAPSNDAGVTGSGLPPPPPTSKARRPFPPEQLAEFKEAVEGSDLSKIGVVEILKKRFPKVSKDTLKATLDQVAVRVGQKEADKKWVCR